MGRLGARCLGYRPEHVVFLTHCAPGNADLATKGPVPQTLCPRVMTSACSAAWFRPHTALDLAVTESLAQATLRWCAARVRAGVPAAGQRRGPRFRPRSRG